MNLDGKIVSFMKRLDSFRAYQHRCVMRRDKRSFGILVNADSDALEWQQLNRDIHNLYNEAITADNARGHMPDEPAAS